MWSLFLSRKHFPDWIATYRMGIDAARRCADHAALSRMHHRLGMAFHNLHRPEQALAQGEEALQFVVVDTFVLPETCVFSDE